MCNHPLLSYSRERPHDFTEGLLRQCGKLWTLDRMLVKLFASGHRVLLFSTMTRVLDVLQVVLMLHEKCGAIRIFYIATTVG